MLIWLLAEVLCRQGAAGCVCQSIRVPCLLAVLSGSPITNSSFPVMSAIVRDCSAKPVILRKFH
jgi:hypothetical protein